MVNVNQNVEQLEEFKQRYIGFHKVKNPEDSTVESGWHYENQLDVLEITADMLSEFLDGWPWWYFSISEIINSRCTENTPLNQLNPVPKAEFCEILMGECLNSIISELALHGREWIHPFDRGQEPTATTHTWQDQGF